MQFNSIHIIWQASTHHNRYQGRNWTTWPRTRTQICNTLTRRALRSYCACSNRSRTFLTGNFYRTLQVTCQRLEAWMSSCGEYHHGNASLNLFTAAPNLIKVLQNLIRRPHVQTKSFPIHWQVTCKALQCILPSMGFQCMHASPQPLFCTHTMQQRIICHLIGLDCLTKHKTARYISRFSHCSVILYNTYLSTIS